MGFQSAGRAAGTATFQTPVLNFLAFVGTVTFLAERAGGPAAQGQQSHHGGQQIPVWRLPYPGRAAPVLPHRRVSCDVDGGGVVVVFDRASRTRRVPGAAATHGSSRIRLRIGDGGRSACHGPGHRLVCPLHIQTKFTVQGLGTGTRRTVPGMRWRSWVVVHGLSLLEWSPGLKVLVERRPVVVECFRVGLKPKVFCREPSPVCPGEATVRGLYVIDTPTGTAGCAVPALPFVNANGKRAGRVA